MKVLGVQVVQRLSIKDPMIFSKSYLSSSILPSDVVFLHGGGNFGDLYRIQTNLRNFILQAIPRNKFILFPQTINYRNRKLAKYDNQIYSNIPDFTIMARSLESYRFANKTFTHNKILLVPDMAFMIGNLKTRVSPLVDIIVFRRIDKEKDFNADEWTNLLNKKQLNKTRKFSFWVRKFWFG